MARTKQIQSSVPIKTPECTIVINRYIVEGQPVLRWTVTSPCGLGYRNFASQQEAVEYAQSRGWQLPF